MRSEIRKKSTIVRLYAPKLAAMLAVALSLAGCAASSTLATQSRACAADEHAVCSSFGPATQCACAPRRDFDQFLASFGEAAWPGGGH
jgi:hypothetical protein